MDNLTPAQRQFTMSRVKSKDTTPELEIRRCVHALGYRYRLHRRDLPGQPDLVFPGRNKVIFVHGCFWHRHRCQQGRKQPSTRVAYWNKKLAGNRQRDIVSRRQLKRSGWDSLIIWECQLRDLDRVAARIVEFLEI